jgi:hypothetical protein
VPISVISGKVSLCGNFGNLMRISVLLLAVLLASGLLLSSPPSKRSAVVVELFTSEGCSSCPPADALLANMRKAQSSTGTEIIPLGFHVDYWNNLGWEDRFSSRAYTERQEKYASQFALGGPYTPQMVVDGSEEFVGNDSRRVERAITQAAGRQQQAQVQLTAVSPDKVRVDVTAPESDSAEVLLAITEDNLSSNVGAGENSGHVLRHAAVVRQFRSLGQLRKGAFQAEAPLHSAKDWKIQDLRVVVMVQAKKNGTIEGAASIPWK